METKIRHRVMHVIRVVGCPSGATPDLEWLIPETAARRAVTLALQESDDPFLTMYAALEYAVCLASGRSTGLLPEPSGDRTETIVPLRPCRVVFGAPVPNKTLLSACGVLAITLVDRLGADDALVLENLSMRACLTHEDLEELATHARKFRADAIVLAIPAIMEDDIDEIVQTMETVSTDLNAAVIIVDGVSSEAYDELLAAGASNGENGLPVHPVVAT